MVERLGCGEVGVGGGEGGLLESFFCLSLGEYFCLNISD